MKVHHSKAMATETEPPALLGTCKSGLVDNEDSSMPTASFKALKTILGVTRKVQSGSNEDLARDFEDLLQDQDIPVQLRDKLRSVDDSVKHAFVLSSTTPDASSSTRRKHQRTRSRNLLSPSKKTRVADRDFTEPCQYIDYLRQKSLDQCKVDVVHTLRILLRSQRVAWLREFLELEGPETIYKQLEHIFSTEWRDEHHDRLLSELLGCVQSMCTTSSGLGTIRPACLKSLIELLFSDKQPSDFKCRQQIMNIMELYLLADASLRVIRAKQLLAILSDAPKPLAERPLDMLERAHTARPYKRWMSEMEKPVRDCFWIFLHSDNRIRLQDPEQCENMVRRKPVVPEGYVGGIEWNAIEYITSHLSLLNTILASLPQDDRTQLRTHLKASRLEKIMGLQLRRASMKYYIYLHEELTIWASRAAADGWETTAVTSGQSRDDGQIQTKTKNSEKGRRHQRTQSQLLPELNFS